MTLQTSSQGILCQIANRAFEVVSRLLERDRLLAESLRTSVTTSRQIYREECITVEMASTLKEEFPNHIDIELFTGPEESRNGADWYWYIEKPNGAIHARVQAKRVQRSEFGQNDSEGHINVDIAQLRNLITAIESHDEKLPGLQAWLATYGRFDATPPCGREPSTCRNHRCGNHCRGFGLPSVWIAQAAEIVNEVRSADVRMGDIVQHSLRLDCILPCIDQGGSAPPSSKGFALDANLPAYDFSIAAIQNDPALRTSFEGAMRIRL